MNESAETRQRWTNSALPRRHEIDALRSIALLLLICYHVFCAYQPFAPFIQFIGFSNTLEDAWFLGELLNTWRVPVLFLISGITAGYLLQNRPVGQLLQSRLMRLVPPLLVTFLCIAPISPALYQVFRGENPHYAPQPGHLWFVWNLVVYFVLGVPLLFYLKHRPDNPVVRLLRLLSPYGWLLILPAVLTLTTWFLEPHITPDTFATHFIRFWYGFACFLCGALLVSLGDHFWQGIRRVCHVALPAALALYLMRMAGVDFGARLPELIVRTMESAYGMLAFLGYGSLAFSRPSRLFSVINRSVFAVYIVHLPVQQAVAFFLFRLELNAWLAFALHLTATLSISALIYTLILLPVRWLHSFFGIAPLKPEPSPGTSATETTPRRRPRPVVVGRFATLYVVSPVFVLLTIGGLVSSAIHPSDVTDDTLERFQREIASRSPEENRAEAEALMEALKEAEEAGLEDRVEILSLEIQMIEDALENNEGDDRQPEDQNLGNK